ncbi:hypothetical protein CC86DRAFT_211606 [Ophiobolus disseminans]|uniref:Uncharacterized protein n=1 Tax=Ophiobolus disseminans TaxID=1469910 RepID=A0A6A7A3Z6_9PLEO|nr:hypothetical protein CC86DRAFT_211606 [Ophiobolus disseminans]
MTQLSTPIRTISTYFLHPNSQSPLSTSQLPFPSSTMSTSRTEDISLETIIELTKANARILYGRHLTYEIVTTGPKVHALLIGYETENAATGKLLKGAYTRGAGRTPPTVAQMVRMLYDETRAEVSGFVGECQERGVLRFC